MSVGVFSLSRRNSGTRMTRLYQYVGSAEIARRVKGIDGLPVESMSMLKQSLRTLGAKLEGGESFITTFVIFHDGVLVLADRSSEHVACAGGNLVLSAGEMTFLLEDTIVVEQATNQSTGYCPEPDSWIAVAASLDRIPIHHPESFHPAFIFRRCAACSQTNIVKDGWYSCDVCQTPLPERWNFI